jgi:hypothetical protein
LQTARHEPGGFVFVRQMGWLGVRMCPSSMAFGNFGHIAGFPAAVFHNPCCFVRRSLSKVILMRSETQALSASHRRKNEQVLVSEPIELFFAGTWAGHGLSGARQLR